MRGWGRDGLGTGRRGGGARARRALMSTTRLMNFGMLPTDPRYLAMRDWECALERRVSAFAERARKRLKDGMPVVSVDDLRAQEDFDEKAAELDARLAAEAAASPPRERPPEIKAEPMQHVIRFRGGER